MQCRHNLISLGPSYVAQSHGYTDGQYLGKIMSTVSILRCATSMAAEVTSTRMQFHFYCFSSTIKTALSYCVFSGS